MAAMIGDFENEIVRTLTKAYLKTSSGQMHRLMLGDQADKRIPKFVREMGESMIPLVAGYVEPIKVLDCACGSGIMFLATAENCPRWTLDWGIVQFYGQDIDRTAEILGVGHATVERDWAFARAWLRRELGGDGHED